MADAAWRRVKPPGARLILQCDAAARGAAACVWGVPFSEEPCRAETNGGRATLWLGPDEHLLLQASRELALPIADLETALVTHPHCLVDVSHRQVALEIFGPHAAAILSGACPLDLDAREFPVQMCTRTVLAKAEIVLWRTAPDAFHLEIWRSFQPYVQALLSEIGREFSGAP
jgi:sarcosine oxidase, subunit gamma